MEEKELKKLTDDLNQSVATLQKSIDSKAAADVVEAMKSDLTEKIAGLSKVGDKSLGDFLEGVQKHLNTIEEKVQEYIEKGKAKIRCTEEQLDMFLKGEEYQGAVKRYKDGQTVMPFTKILTVTSDLTAGNNQVILPERELGVSAAPRADTPIYNLVQKGTTMKDKISWIERTLASESPGTVAQSESGAFGESDALWTEVDINVKKITDMFKATREILEDTDFVRSEIMDMLTTNIPHYRETQLLSGTGSTVYLKGLLTSAKTFSLPTGVAAVADPNNYDVLKAAMLQCMIGYNATSAYTKGYMANAIVLNPVDVLNMELEKDANNNYILPPFKSANGLILSGAPVIQSTDMTVGSFLVADMGVAKYFTRRGLEVRFWDQYDTDPAYDRVLFTASERGALRVTNIGAYGLVTGTFAAGLAALTA